MSKSDKSKRKKKAEQPGGPTDEQAFHAFVYAGFAGHIDRLARTIAAKFSLKNQAKPTEQPPEVILTTDKIRRILNPTEEVVGAGKAKVKHHKIKALTLVELLYNAKLVDAKMLCAADRFRELHAEREGEGRPSQGVGSYGNNPGGANPSTKADRAGHRLTGYEINGREWSKDAKWSPPPQPKSNSYDYEAARLAMCGVIAANGERVHDHQLTHIMVSAIVDTVNIPTQTHVAKLRTGYTGDKQLPPAGATVISEALKRLMLHLQG